MPDGKQFVVITSAGASADANPSSAQQINVVLNWFEEPAPRADREAGEAGHPTLSRLQPRLVTISRPVFVYSVQGPTGSTLGPTDDRPRTCLPTHHTAAQIIRRAYRVVLWLGFLSRFGKLAAERDDVGQGVR